MHNTRHWNAPDQLLGLATTCNASDATGAGGGVLVVAVAGGVMLLLVARPLIASR